MNTKTSESQQVEQGFLLKWILLSTIGCIVVIAIVLGVLFGSDINQQLKNPQEDTIWLLTWLVFSVVGGAIGGVSQWFVLRGRLLYLDSWVRPPIWVWSAILSYGMGSFTLFFWGLRDFWSMSYLACVGLALSGIPQWFVLRLYLSKAGWWLIGVPIGLVVSCTLVVFYYGFVTWDVGHNYNYLVIELGVFSGAIGGVVFGFITAGALSVLLRSSDSHPPGSGQDTI